MIETFADQPDLRWRFFTDGVMGGLSTGRVAFLSEDGRRYARMTGKVSTANRGGFIQMRMAIDHPLPPTIQGVRLVVRGNDQPYFVHLRSRSAQAPTAFYRASFKAGPDWQEISLPFHLFQPSSAALPAVFAAPEIGSVAIVAHGRDHEADISTSELGFY